MNDEAQRLLRAYRDGLVPPAGAQSAAWARLSSVTAAAPAAGGALPAIKLLSAVVLGIAIGGGAIGLLLGDRAAPPPPEPEPVLPIAAAAPEPSPVAVLAAAPAPAAPPVVEAPAEPARSRPRPPAAPIRPEEPAVDGVETFAPSTLAEETRLLAAAEAALAAGDAGAALVILDDHAARFPSGVLARDRDVRRVGALCRLDRRADARALASELERRHPSLHERLERACPAE